MAKQPPPPPQTRPVRRLIQHLIKAPAVWSILWPLGLMLFGFMAWQTWGADHFARRYYGIESSKISVSPPPPAIQPHVRDIVATVYQKTKLDQLSLLDSQASAKIASAFAMHHWVHQVVSVRKLPGGGVDVRLVYREPVAMVYVDRKSCPGLAGFHAIDADSVLLPGEDFSDADTKRFIHIEIPGFCPTGTHVGWPLGDQRLQAAAALAGFLKPVREPLSIRMITTFGDPRENPIPQLVLLTGTDAAWQRYCSDGNQEGLTRFFWGSPPGSEYPGEPTAAMKLETLRDGLGGGDLRMARPDDTTPNRSATPF